MSKEEVVALIRESAARLKRNPTFRDLRRFRGLEAGLYKNFRGLGEALQAAGLEPRGAGFKAPTAALLLDWAAVARKLRSIPTATEYRRHGRYSTVPFAMRFGGWLQVPKTFRGFARQQGIESRWADVLRRIAARDAKAMRALHPSLATPGKPGAEAAPHTGSHVARLRRKLRSGRPVYGAPLSLPGLAHEPVNEAGVIYLFGAIAHRLGFLVQRIQPGFPDCEALHEAEPGKWQRLRIEFEFSSRAFQHHRHRKEDCDMIVCWIHDWPDCPRELEVLELQRIVRGLNRVI